jgi:transcriptional regulator with XRE-family HTH domain
MGWREKLKAAREARRLSQIELADQLGLNQSTISKWEKGPNKPDIGWVIQLANVLAFDVAWLLNNERPDDPPSVQEVAVRATFEKVLAMDGPDVALEILLRGAHSSSREQGTELGRITIKPSRTNPGRGNNVVAADSEPLTGALPGVRVPLGRRHHEQVKLDNRPAREKPIPASKLRRKK